MRGLTPIFSEFIREMQAILASKGRERERVGGRRPSLTPEQKDEVRRMRDDEHRKISEIAHIFGVNHMTIRRV